MNRRSRELSLLVLGTGLVTIAAGRTSGHTASPIVDPPDAAFHAVTRDVALTEPREIVMDDFGQPTLVPKPIAVVPAPGLVVLPVATPRPRPTPSPKPLPRPTPGPTSTPRPVTYPSVADAQAYARRVLGATQFACLDQIAIRESDWNPYGDNPSSGAYGIPQALPGSKMATAGADWRVDPVTQVRWMIGYVDAGYGSACGAWSYWQSHGWY